MWHKVAAIAGSQQETGSGSALFNGLGGWVRRIFFSLPLLIKPYVIWNFSDDYLRWKLERVSEVDSFVL